ncbi:MAG: hypothetical protein KAW02_03070 [candidate division Zixibacteria bacterium]|nr:hypothetical protein [candidate division Zixibacteria bacterium]
MTQSLLTQVRWTVEFVNRDKANHHITIEVFFLDCAVPTIHDSILLLLPETNFRDFTTWVEKKQLPQNYGLDGENMLYCLELKDIRKHVNEGQSPVIVDIKFQQSNMVRKIFGANSLDFGFKSHFLNPVSTEFLIHLPRITSPVKRVVSTIIGWLTRRRSPYEILTIGTESDSDETKGTIRIPFRDVFPDFRIAYKVVGAINLASLVAGFILGVIVSALGSWLYDILSR